jgi:hypothetical protein
MTPELLQLCGGGSRQRPTVRVVDRVISLRPQTMPDGNGNAIEGLLWRPSGRFVVLVFAIVGAACDSQIA